MTEAILMVGDSFSDQSLFYQTHFLASDPFIYLKANGRSVLVIGDMERGRAQKESTVDEVQVYDDYGYEDLLQELDDRNQAFTQVIARAARGVDADRVVVSGRFPALFADNLRQDGLEVKIEPRLLVSERRRKSPEEVAGIEEAQRATERATAHAVEIVAASQERNGILHFQGIPLTSERLRAEIEVALTRDNMDTSHSPIVAGGPGAADPHWLGAGPLKAGEAIVLDIFPRSKRTRYFADMTRTVVRGDPGDLLRSMYDAVLQGQEAALAQIRAGANGRDVHTAVEEVFRERGFAGEGPGPRYTHGTGHGVGLDIHEAPNLGTTDVELLEGDVITVEPGLYDPEIGAIRIEDMVVVTRDGYKNLTNFPKQFEL